jgi:hypothetical protein
MVFWVVTLNLKAIINVLEKHAASIFKVEASWEGIWNSFIGKIKR